MKSWLINKEKDHLDDVVKAIKESKKDVFVSIQSPSRSLSQNALYWANIDIIAKFQGCTKDEASACIKQGISSLGWLKMKYLYDNGKIMTEVEKSTADLNKKDFSLLIEYVYQVGTFLDLAMIYPEMIGLPNDFYEKTKNENPNT